MERGQLSFAPWSPLAKEGIPLTIPQSYVVYQTELNESLTQSYEGLFSKVITPQKNIII